MFKDKLKENRTRLGLSQEDLAIKIFVSRSAVAKWEQGRGIPEEDTLAKLSVLFNVPSGELLSQEDMKEEIKANDQDLAKNKRKVIISASVAGASVLALVITLLCGAFVYHPSGEETVETVNVTSVEKKDERVTALSFSNGTRLNYSQWREAEFHDEVGSAKEAISELHLRQGDSVELSYLADRNLFGQKRVGSLGVSEITLNGHPYDGKTQTLNGVGCTFVKSGSSAYGAFSPEDTSSAYLRFYEVNPEDDAPTIDMDYHNCLYCHAAVNGLYADITMQVAFDPTVLAYRTIETYFNDYSNQWSDTYYDMANNTLAGVERVAAMILGKMDYTFTGTLPTAFYPFGYQYVIYHYSVEAKENPSGYQIKSYDSSDTLLQTISVGPTTDLTTLSLPENRSYSIVEEYRKGGLAATSEKIGKGATWHLYFANAAGFYDRTSARVTL